MIWRINIILLKYLYHIVIFYYADCTNFNFPVFGGTPYFEYDLIKTISPYKNIGRQCQLAFEGPVKI